MLEQERELKEAVNVARAMRDARTSEAEELKRRDEQASDRLGAVQFKLPKIPKIATEQSLVDYREHVNALETKLVSWRWRNILCRCSFRIIIRSQYIFSFCNLNTFCNLLY